MASATKCIRFSTLLLVVYLIMGTEADDHLALNALLATGIITILLRGKHGGHGHGRHSHLSALSHGNYFGHHSSFSGFNLPHNFGIHQNPIRDFNMYALHHGLGNGFNLGMIKHKRHVQNVGTFTNIPHITGLKQGNSHEIHPSIPSRPLHGSLNNVPFLNSGHKHISLQGQIPSAPAVTSGSPFGYKKPAGAVQNPQQHFVEEIFVMPRLAADELIEILGNSNAYADFNENLESEEENEDFIKSNYPPSPEQIYQYDPRSSADISYENSVPNSQ